MTKISKIDNNTKDILHKCVRINKTQKIIVLYDVDCKLSILLKDSYIRNLKDYDFEALNFADKNEVEWKEYLYKLDNKNVVVLIQSTSFRISEFRVRLDLNNRGVLVVEHVRLKYMKDEECDTYINSLEYDEEYYKEKSDKLLKMLKIAKKVEVVSTDDSVLTCLSELEDPKANIGDFSANKGSLFPIGEVFTELKDLSKMNGEILIYAFPSDEHRTVIVKPFKAVVVNGSIVSQEGPKEIELLFELVRKENSDERLPLREIGFGLNRAIGKDRPLNDISSHERQSGFHMSLGMKHAIYRKKIPKEINQRFHIDLFIDVKEIRIDDEVVFRDGCWV